MGNYYDEPSTSSEGLYGFTTLYELIKKVKPQIPTLYMWVRNCSSLCFAFCCCLAFESVLFALIISKANEERRGLLINVTYANST